MLKDQVPCWLTYTNTNTHEIIDKNLGRSAMYSGVIKGTGPRYCPSIEDKYVRFNDKERHQLFLEPEGRNTKKSMYKDYQPLYQMMYKETWLEYCRIRKCSYYA